MKNGKIYPTYTNGKYEYIPVDELSEEYKQNQIRYLKRKISYYQDLLSLLQ